MLNVEMWNCGNMTTERAVWVGVGGDKEVGAGGAKFENVKGNIGGSPLLVKISHPPITAIFEKIHAPPPSSIPSFMKGEEQGGFGL